MYSKADLEGWVASQNPEERKKVVNILKDDFGMKMSDIVRLQPPDRVAKVLEFQAAKGGKAAAGKPAGAKAAASAAGKPSVGKKAAVKQPEPEPEPEEEETEEQENAGGASLEEAQAAMEASLAPLLEVLTSIQEALPEILGAAQRAEIMAKQAALAGGFSEEDLDALVSGE